MSTTLTEAPAETCEWCGRANTERLPSCAGCGTRLVSELPAAPSEKRKGKDRMAAVCFALIAGSLGLIYINAWGNDAGAAVVDSRFFFATHSGGVWVVIGIRLVSGGFAYGLFDRQGDSRDTVSEAAELLQTAARLESVDREKAIAAYREVLRLYPNTPASSEATRNIQVLMRHAAK